jgi:hypothetical protein
MLTEEQKRMMMDKKATEAAADRAMVDAGPPSQDFFGGKKMTPYMAGTAIGKMTGIGTKGAALGKMSSPEQVPAMAEPSDPGYDREDEIVG